MYTCIRLFFDLIQLWVYSEFVKKQPLDNVVIFEMEVKEWLKKGLGEDVNYDCDMINYECFLNTICYDDTTNRYGAPEPEYDTNVIRLKNIIIILGQP